MTGHAMKPQHEPDQDTYDCRACGRPWPCRPAQLHMIATMSPTTLRINQWTILEQAVPVLVGITVKQAWDRFLGWTGNQPA